MQLNKRELRKSIFVEKYKRYKNNRTFMIRARQLEKSMIKIAFRLKVFKKRKKIEKFNINENEEERWSKILDKNVLKIVTQKFLLRIIVQDLETLLDGEWLNDQLLNFYFQLISERSIYEKNTNVELPLCFCYNTFFIKKLTKDFKSYK